MSDVASYLRYLSGAETARAAARALAPRLGVNEGALQVACSRDRLSARWWPGLVEIAAADGRRAPPRELFDPPARRAAPPCPAAGRDIATGGL